MVVGVSPFGGGVVVGGKGGVMMMVVWRAGPLQVYALRLFVVVAVHRTSLPYPCWPARLGNGNDNGASAPPPQPQIPHITPVRTHCAEVVTPASHRGDH